MSRNYRFLILIALILLFAIYINIPKSPGIHFAGIDRNFTTRLGLDLVGGVQALLEADVPASQTIDPKDMNVAVQIVDNRVNGLGVSEAIVQPAGSNRIVVELPGETDPEKALATIKQTGLLEFVDMSSLSTEQAYALETKKVNTDWVPGIAQPSQNIIPSPSPTNTITSTLPISLGPTFHTVMTGANLKNVLC